MKILSLDVSTHLGWALFEGETPTKYGLLEVQVKDFKSDIRSYRDYSPTYPANLLDASWSTLSNVKGLIDEHKPDFIVIEETNKAKQRFSQKLLEWMHYCLVSHFISQDLKFGYLTSNCWRKQVNCYVKNWPEYTRWNAQVGRAKKKATPTKAGAKVAKIDGKIVTRIDSKKLSIIIANAKYGLEIDDDNIADALNMGRAAVELKIFKLPTNEPVQAVDGQDPNKQL